MISPQTLLTQPKPQDHIVKFYQHQGSLVEAVGSYILDGLRRREAVVVIAAPANRFAFERVVTAAGHSIDELRASRRLLLLDAEDTLTRFMIEGRPVWHLFCETVAETLAAAADDSGAPGLRLYGEMVDVLWQQGRTDAAVAVERHWERLLRAQRFPLFCAYRLDPLAPGLAAETLDALTGSHTHVLPTEYGRLDPLVDLAMGEALGEERARLLRRRIVSSRHSGTAMPSAEATILWLKRHLPESAERVLEEARRRMTLVPRGADPHKPLPRLYW